MARPPKVTRDHALTQAMKVFWSKGYNATSVDDLQASMGLKRGSFYLHFQDKRNLFFEVLDHYKMSVVERRRARVKNEASPAAGIRLFFDILISESLANPECAGCLNTNTVTELGLIDAELSERMGAGVRAWVSFWAEQIERAKACGELPVDTDSLSRAQLLVALTQGLNVVVKVNPDRKFLDGVVRAGLSFLDT